MQFLTYSRHSTNATSLLLSTLMFLLLGTMRAMCLLGTKGRRTMWPSSRWHSLAGLSEFEFWFCHLLSVWPWIDYFTPLCLYYLVCKMAIIIPILHRIHSFQRYLWHDTIARHYSRGWEYINQEKRLKFWPLWLSELCAQINIRYLE